MGLERDCKYFYGFSLTSAKKITDYSCCTNRPIKCDLCKCIYWSYNMRKNYELKHINCVIPAFVTDEDVEKIEKTLLITNFIKKIPNKYCNKLLQYLFGIF